MRLIAEELFISWRESVSARQPQTRRIGERVRLHRRLVGYKAVLDSATKCGGNAKDD